MACHMVAKREGGREREREAFGPQIYTPSLTYFSKRFYFLKFLLPIMLSN